ncbi:MAG: GerMN domain-containing protein [Nocardioidaceae bacterium]|nr:GerMN domain-containing protein [Nocardioidaceae bacterium]
MRRRRAALVAGLVLALTSLTGCLAVPDHGPVVEAGDSSEIRAGEPPDIVPATPEPGESASDIVRHFLEAMRASPIDTTIAKQFLTKDAAATWSPEQATITYASTSAPFGVSPLKVRLQDAAHYDDRGTYLGALPASERTLSFPLQLEDGQWRIAEAPNALIVNDDWFDQRFAQVSLYFFDPSGKYLVPEPVFLPRGDQLPTALMQGLLAGPPAGLERVERTFIPTGTALDLSVPPVSGSSGLADIALSGVGGRLSADTATLLLAQLSWTLRQVPGVKTLSVTVDGQPLGSPSGSKTVPVDGHAEADPTGWLASATPFGLWKGLVVGDAVANPQPVAGPFGLKKRSLRSIAVDPYNIKVAGVDITGRSVLLTSLSAPDARVTTVATEATNLLPPAWDLAGRLWLVDRRSTGAFVEVYTGGSSPVEVPAPGIAGQRVRAFEVSRDGTRFVAVLAGADGDTVVVSRVERRLDGSVRLTPAVALPSPSGTALLVKDIGWSSPTTASVLSSLTDDVSQLSAVPLDGSPGRTITTVPGVQRWLVSSPVESEPTFVVSANGIVDLSSGRGAQQREDILLSSLTYVG